MGDNGDDGWCRSLLDRVDDVAGPFLSVAPLDLFHRLEFLVLVRAMIFVCLFSMIRRDRGEVVDPGEVALLGKSTGMSDCPRTYQVSSSPLEASARLLFLPANRCFLC